jgi:CBS-domain-containing membrane protein
MNIPLDSVYVSDLMHRNPLTVGVVDQVSDVARRFQFHAINSAPVVDSEGVCVGLITSTDLVRFEASRKALEDRWRRGEEFDSARYDNGLPAGQLRYDQVGSLMTKQFQTVSAGVALVDAIALMYNEQKHHLLILDGLGKPYGILSSLDILGYLIGRRTEL